MFGNQEANEKQTNKLVAVVYVGSPGYTYDRLAKKQAVSAVHVVSDGYTYDRPAIQAWLETGKDRSPMTNAVLPHKTLTPNRTLKMVIQKHLEQAAT